MNLEKEIAYLTCQSVNIDKKINDGRRAWNKLLKYKYGLLR